MTHGFVKLHRKILEHDWLNDRPEYRVAWEDILMKTDYQTGVVNLTEVPAKRYFTKSSWQRFVQRLEAEDMIHDLTITNRGRRLGKQQTATVTKFLEYHEDGSATGKHPHQQRESKRDSTRATGTTKTPDRGSARGSAAGEQRESTVASLYKEERIKKLRREETTPPTPPRSRPVEQPGDFLKDLTNETPLDTLRRAAPGAFQVFEELARLQRTGYAAKLAQAQALLDRVGDKGAERVEESLRTILSTAGDGGRLFTRALAHLERSSPPTPQAADRSIFQLIGAKGQIGEQEFQIIAVTPDHAKLMTDIGRYLTPDEFQQYRVEACLN